MAKGNKKRDEMVEFAKEIADKIAAKYPDDDAQYLVRELLADIMNATSYHQKQAS